MTKYSSTHQEKQFASPPVFVGTFQGGLPWIDQESRAAPCRVEQQPSFTSHFQKTSTGTPRLCLSLQLPSLCAVPAASQPSPVLQPLSLTGIPRSQGAGCSEDWESQRASPQCLQEHSCAPDFVTEVTFPSLAEPALHLQQPLVMNIFSVWQTQHKVARKTEILFCLWSGKHCLLN